MVNGVGSRGEGAGGGSWWSSSYVPLSMYVSSFYLFPNHDMKLMNGRLSKKLEMFVLRFRHNTMVDSSYGGIDTLLLAPNHFRTVVQGHPRDYILGD